MKFIAILALTLVIVCATADRTKAASFDCSKAASASEKLICSDKQLSAMDKRLGELYRQAFKKSPDKEGLKKEQQNWIKDQRDACRDVPAMLTAYEARVSVLESGVHTTMKDTLKEANEHFTFRGKPINPRALEELLPWISDKLPGPVAVDIEGSTADTNRYLAQVAVNDKGLATATRTESGKEVRFSYKDLGVLADGAHVLETRSNTGGTMTFAQLLLVKFAGDTEYINGGALRDRLVMTRVGAFDLGDRYDGSIKVEPNEITIGAGAGREKAEVITFK